MSDTVDDLTAAYRMVLSTADPAALSVLTDLADRFHASVSTQRATPEETAFANGQRAVWLYIAGRLGLPLMLRS